MVTPTGYGTCGDLRAITEWRHECGLPLIDGALTLVKSVRGRLAELGVTVMYDEFLGPDLADSVDPLKVVLDLEPLGISGYQAADWLREHRRGHRRPVRPPPDRGPVRPLPRDVFFGEAEQVPVAEAAGRIAAEMITPYPPGAPGVLPGEVITQPILDSRRSGLGAGRQLPDPASELKSIRVVAPR